jgi:hypothetical protein
MSVELDHVFIMCDVGAPEAACLAKMGFIEGPPNVHSGQGTACRRFLFADTFLELLWVSAPPEAQNDTPRPTRLWDRWVARGQAACPFGIALRPASHDVPRPPFPTWSYRPSYLPPGTAIDVAVDTPIEEPEFFYLPIRRSWRTAEPHEPGPGTSVKHLRVGVPTDPAPPASRWASSMGLMSFEPHTPYLLTITFDDACRGLSADCRPHLPLRFRW